MSALKDEKTCDAVHCGVCGSRECIITQLQTRVAFVDDDERFLDTLSGYADRAAKEAGVECHIDRYRDGDEFLERYTGAYDMVFLDIAMPGSNGMDVAHRLREVDDSVCLIFVTSMARYAVEGYEVDALDFMVKPVEYPVFRDKFRRALRYQMTRREFEVVIGSDAGMVRLRSSQIYYVEKDKNKNYLVYHTSRGQVRERGTITRKQELLANHGFGKCSSGCLVNYRHVESVGKDTVTVQGKALPLSRRERRPFLDALMRYLGQGGR